VQTDRKRSRDRAPDFDCCEGRDLLSTLVFVLNGNGYADARPSILTADAARVLRQAGERPIQLSYPALATPAAVAGVAAEMKALSHGQPFGIVGFSAGGSLALRLAEIPSLHVVDVLNDYGPPDLKDFLADHHGDGHARFVTGHTRFTRAGLNFLSGPGKTSAHLISAFGLTDLNTLAPQSTASFLRDFPQGKVYDYPGRHGVSISACPAALDDFLAHLG